MTTTNKYKVPKRQWRKWSHQARKVFNELYRELLQSWEIIYPKDLHSVHRNARRVACWNAAWLAADACKAAQETP